MAPSQEGYPTTFMNPTPLGEYPSSTKCIAALKGSIMPCGVTVPMKCIYKQK